MSRESLVDKELDGDFIKATIMIQNSIGEFSKQEQLRVEKWVSKLARMTAHIEWKKNRNVYISLLMQNVLEKKALESPFNKSPPTGNLPQLRPPTRNGTGKSIQNPSGMLTMGRAMKSEEIARLIEANLLSIQEDESPDQAYQRNSDEIARAMGGRAVFELSPRDTQGARTVKFDSSTMYEVTPSKSNRYRSGTAKEGTASALLSSIRKHNLHSSMVNFQKGGYKEALPGQRAVSHLVQGSPQAKSTYEGFYFPGRFGFDEELNTGQTRSVMKNGGVYSEDSDNLESNAMAYLDEDYQQELEDDRDLEDEPEYLANYGVGFPKNRLHQKTSQVMLSGTKLEKSTLNLKRDIFSTSPKTESQIPQGYQDPDL